MVELPLLRTSERSTFKRCRQKWWWAYVEELQKRHGTTTPALTFGDHVHQSLAEFYLPGRKRGPRPARTYKKIYTEWVKDHGIYHLRGDDDRFEAGELGVGILERYYDTYGEDEDIEIVAPEMPFAVKLKDLGGKPFWYVGRLDAMALWVPTGEYCILEHKTGSENKKAALQMDEQAGSYWAMTPKYLEWLRKHKLLTKNIGVVDLEFILYNFLRKALDDPRPKNRQGQYLNKDGKVSKSQPPKHFERIPVYRDDADRRSITYRIRAEQFEMRLIREGKLPVYKNPTDNCSWDCPFYDMCELHETGSDWRGFKEQMYISETDNYAEYRADTKEIREEVSNGSSSKKTARRH
jgi:hypothetical protein